MCYYMEAYWNGMNPYEPDYDEPPYIQGPVKFDFSISLRVADCPPEP